MDIVLNDRHVGSIYLYSYLIYCDIDAHGNYYLFICLFRDEHSKFAE